MDRDSLLFNNQSPTVSMSRKKLTLVIGSAFALGIAACMVALTGRDASVSSDQNVNLWLNQPKNKFDWNKTEALNWDVASQFVSVAASPMGNMYGIQRYSKDGIVYQLGYEFDFITGVWKVFDKDFQMKDIKFDKVGNFYLLDLSGNLYAKNSKDKIILRGIQDFGINTQNEIFAISFNVSQSNSEHLLNTFINGDGFRYKMYANKNLKKITVANEQPVFIDSNDKIVGYGFECVKELSAGVDGSLWALACDIDEGGNYQLIKWDPFMKLWYGVKDAQGVKIASFNEISVSLLDKQGRIQFSSQNNQNKNLDFIGSGKDLDLFSDSQILNATTKNFVQNLVTDYSIATLCWRGSRDGFSAQTFHQKCDFQGPSLTIIQTKTKKVFGAYTSRAWTSAQNYLTDKDAFAFTTEKGGLSMMIGPNTQYAIYDHNNYGPTFGNGHDIYVVSNSNASSSSYTNFGFAYTLPVGVLINEPKKILHGDYNFVTDEVEVYILI